MTHNFEIKVQCKGDAVGTLGWLNSLLADGELVIKNTKDGVAGMFFHYFHDKQGNETKPNEGNTFICKPIISYDGEYEYEQEPVNGALLKCVYPVSDEHACGFVDYPLTPAAKEKLTEFLEKAKEQFVEWWNNQ